MSIIGCLSCTMCIIQLVYGSHSTALFLVEQLLNDYNGHRVASGLGPEAHCRTHKCAVEHIRVRNLTGPGQAHLWLVPFHLSKSDFFPIELGPKATSTPKATFRQCTRSFHGGPLLFSGDGMGKTPERKSVYDRNRDCNKVPRMLPRRAPRRHEHQAPAGLRVAKNVQATIMSQLIDVSINALISDGPW